MTKPTIDFRCDWKQFANPSRFNWITLTLIQIEPEWDRVFGRITLTLTLLGFGVHLGWTYNSEADGWAQLDQSFEDLINGNGSVSIPLAEWEQVKADAKRWRDSVPVESLGREA